MMRKYNFCSGPAAMPEAVLKKAQAEMLNWKDKGCSVMELSHRSDAFVELAENAEKKLRRLMGIGDNYAVLFCHGSATHQFSMIPMNLLHEGESANYLNTGTWSDKAVKEAKRYGQANEIKALKKENDLFTVSPRSEWTLLPKAKYFHYCPNETIGGVEFSSIPVSNETIVADMSSCILSKPINVNDYGLIYAGAQKNIGPAGMTIVIIRKDLMGHANKNTPTLFDYKIMADNGSMYNTPPTWAWYLADLVFDWLEERGGVEALGQLNAQKANMLYAAIDQSDFYRNPIDPVYRSRMNVPFVLADESLNDVFLQESEHAGLLALAGHRSVGGMRASIYNAMPVEGVQALIAFMAEFAKRHG